MLKPVSLHHLLFVSIPALLLASFTTVAGTKVYNNAHTGRDVKVTKIALYGFKLGMKCKKVLSLAKKNQFKAQVFSKKKGTYVNVNHWRKACPLTVENKHASLFFKYRRKRIIQITMTLFNGTDKQRRKLDAHEVERFALKNFGKPSYIERRVIQPGPIKRTIGKFPWHKETGERLITKFGYLMIYAQRKYLRSKIPSKQPYAAGPALIVESQSRDDALITLVKYRGR